jgi:hypothetical protein
MENGTWYNCSSPKGDWLIGEYLIEKAPKAGIVIWVNNQAGVTGIKSFKKAYKILADEFEKVEKIDR